MKDKRVHWLGDKYESILEKIRKGELKPVDLFGPQSENLPPRTGYYVGYRLVDDFVRRTGVSDIQFLIKDENQILMDF